jgi:hypothetical protein
MSLINCKECGREVSSKADQCPGCGARLKKKTGCLKLLGYGFATLFVLAVIGSIGNRNKTPSNSGTAAITDAPDSAAGTGIATSAPKPHRQGETVHVGPTSYLVTRSRFSTHVSNNDFLDSKPDASFLLVYMTVRNDDTKARFIPPFMLVDEKGSEYETSSAGVFIEGALGGLDNLNPGVQKSGFVVFDVPETHKYSLKVSGAGFSGDDTLITLTPQK